MPLSNGCFNLSDNFIEVNRTETDGAEVALSVGGTSIDVCVNDGISDELSFTNTSSVTAPYAYIITDNDNNVIGVADGDAVDFEGAGAGICRIWGLSYTGNLTVATGENATAQSLSDDCFNLSGNFITINRESVDGGTVSLADGSVSALVCANDGNPDLLSFDAQSSSTANYAFVITDSNNDILSVLDGNMVDFDVAGAGVCRVWGLSYTGTIIAEPGDNAAGTTLSDLCFDLSDNFITINRVETDGGNVSTPEGETTVYTCPGDGIDDIINFITDSQSDALYAYVVTDDNNNILTVADGNNQNFDGAPEGTCRVWGLSYVGNIIAEEGQDAATAALTDDCFELSANFITVIRQAPDGGTVSTTDGAEASIYLS